MMVRSSEEINLRQEMIDYCIKMNETGLNQGTSGNISFRWGDGILITPTGMDYGSLVPEDIVWMSLSDDRVEGRRKPSSEWRFHRDIIKTKSNINAVIHNHSLYATSIAVTGKCIPSHHYMTAISGGDTIRCAKYATFGTEELSKNVLEALEGRSCCIIENHGTIATGKNLSKAFSISVEMENLAKQYVFAKLVGTPLILSKEEMTRVLNKFKDYGKQSSLSGEGDN